MFQYSRDYLRMLRNDIPIDSVIMHLLKMEVRKATGMLRFRCPMCGNYHTAVKAKTNLARCFDCGVNFNPIDLVKAVLGCSFLDAVQYLEKSIS